MELIIDFYKNLDTLNLIIFWGIIIVIILLLIFSIIMINKNKKLRKIVENNSNKYEEDIPIKTEEIEPSTTTEEQIKQEKISNKNHEYNEFENTDKIIEEEKEFIAEEHVIEYNQDMNSQNNNYNDESLNNNKNEKKPIEMPTGPYQRNVLREMSLSQTSPIGINRQPRNDEKKVEMVNDLKESLSIEQTENKISQKDEIKKELTNIENTSPRRTTIPATLPSRNKEINEKNNLNIEQQKHISATKEMSADELLNSQSKINVESKQKSSSEQYLEEVSKKLAEAEIPDEIKRTNYELEQEENAIISYTELMEKKDSIQTIDEEDAIISIEELMNRNNSKETEQSKISNEESKLYNLTEEQENDNFIKELKQFRNDL